MPITLLPFGALADLFGASATVAVSGILVAIFIGAIALMFAGYFLKVSDSASLSRSETFD